MQGSLSVLSVPGQKGSGMPCYALDAARGEQVPTAAGCCSSCERYVDRRARDSLGAQLALVLVLAAVGQTSAEFGVGMVLRPAGLVVKVGSA